MPEKRFNQRVKYTQGLPVLPGRYPIIGHAWVFTGDTGAKMRDAFEVIGPIFWLDLYMSNYILMCSGEDGLELLRSKSVTTAHFRQWTMAAIILGECILVQDGEAHRHVRSALGRPFTPRGLNTNTIGGVTASVLTSSVAGWATQKRVQILQETQKATLEAIFRAVGVPLGKMAAFRKRYEDLLFGGRFPPIMLPGFPAYNSKKAREWLDREVKEIVDQARLSPNPDTIISHLLAVKDDEGQPLTDLELVENIRFMVLAGHETTAGIMAWMVIELARHPEHWDALCDEAMKATGIPTSSRDAADFPFAEALFRETARLYPPQQLLDRTTTDWLTCHHYRIPPGTHIGVSAPRELRDPAVYPDPDRFSPERWLGRSNPPTFTELCAFGAGQHFCLGYHLAWLEMVQCALALARTMHAKGLRPRLGDGPAPQRAGAGTSMPSRDAVVEFV